MYHSENTYHGRSRDVAACPKIPQKTEDRVMRMKLKGILWLRQIALIIITSEIIN